MYLLDMMLTQTFTKRWLPEPSYLMYGKTPSQDWHDKKYIKYEFDIFKIDKTMVYQILS